MKSPCEFYNIEANKGTSKTKEWGGFTGLFAGAINAAIPGSNPTPPFGFGTLGFFWTNSPTGTVNNVNIRSLYSNINTVLRLVGQRYIL